MSVPDCLLSNLFSKMDNFYCKMKFLKQIDHIRYVIAKLSKFVKVNMHTSSDSFLQMIFGKLKRAWN